MHFSKTLIAAFAVVLSAGGVRADDSVLLARYHDWSAFTSVAGSVCWAATLPRRRETPDGMAALSDTKDVFLMMTHTPNRYPAFELSYTTGTGLPAGAQLTLKTALADFALFHKDGWAWVEKTERQQMAVVALRQAEMLRRDVQVLTVAGGAGARYRFSTAGLQAALDHIARRCP